MIDRLTNSLAILLFAIVMFSGCSITDDKTREYYNSAKEFNNLYFQVVEQIDVRNTMKSLESLQTEENRLRIEKLGELLDNIKKTIPKDREMLYHNFKYRYEDLVFLGESYKKSDQLSEEERARVFRSTILISTNKKDWKNKKSTTVWE